MIDDATLIPRGSRLRLTLASNSLAQNPANLLYLNLPMPAAARISIGEVKLVLPVLRHPVSRLDVSARPCSRRRRSRSRPRESPAEPPE